VVRKAYVDFRENAQDIARKRDIELRAERRNRRQLYSDLAECWTVQSCVALPIIFAFCSPVRYTLQDGEFSMGKMMYVQNVRDWRTQLYLPDDMWQARRSSRNFRRDFRTSGRPVQKTIHIDRAENTDGDCRMARSGGHE